jgi:hypothetical protein
MPMNRQEGFPMKKYQGFLAAAIASLTFATAAHANTMWDFSYSGGGVSASGSFETIGNGSTPSEVTAITGTYSDGFITDGVIDGVVALGTDSGRFNYDNDFGGTPVFSNPGLLFDVNGTQHVNIYSAGTDFYNVTYENGGTPNTLVTLEVTAVPEPTSMALLLAGLGALGIASRRRNRAQ